jgi:hypothetical protein
MSKMIILSLNVMSLIGYVFTILTWFFDFGVGVQLPLFVALFFTALSFHGYASLKGFSYTVFMIIVVCIK